MTEANEKYLELIELIQEQRESKNTKLTEVEKNSLLNKINDLFMRMSVEEKIMVQYDISAWKENIKEEKLSNTSSLRINKKICILHITWRCNFGCDNCVANCGKKQAPSNEVMSLESIEKFISDTIECKHHYDMVTVTGGEPTLHPKFKEICAMFSKANIKDQFASCLLLGTNGYAPHTKEMIKIASSFGFTIENQNKTEQQRNKTMKAKWHPFNVAPIDVGYEPSLNGCHWSGCGISYDQDGYWGCGSGPHFTRIFDGLKPACTSIKDLTDENIRKSFAQICKLCGGAFPIKLTTADYYLHLSEQNEHIDIVTTQPISRVVNQTMSKTWVEAFKKYKEKEEEKLRTEDGY
jgi:hypothetical protein